MMNMNTYREKREVIFIGNIDFFLHKQCEGEQNSLAQPIIDTNQGGAS